MNLSLIGVYDSESDVVTAVKTYELKGYKTEKFSVLALEEEKMNSIQTKTRIHHQHPASEEAFGIISGFLTGISGGFIVPGLTVPGIGPLIAAGPLAAYFEGTSRKDVKDLLLSCGLSEENANEYFSKLTSGKILLFYEEK
ncbi:sulfate transporter [Siminovitchia sp. 179-K 8D1 HS]|uniref:sulfate transporter n=1 Tax=Siminovitchia sp. 179-K 8D1 HS TaxID=3142385 RepID=UPI0039A1B696